MAPCGGRPRARCLRAALGSLVFAAFAVAPGATAVALLPGDGVVADPDARGVFVVDLGSGAASKISAGGALLYPSGVAVDALGDVFVADPDANAIWQIDPSDGSQALVCSGAPFLQPTGVASAPDGKLLVADPVANAIFELTRETCAAVAVISGAPLRFPTGVRVEPDGDVLVADPDVDAVLRFSDGNPPQVVASGDLLRSPEGVALDPEDLLVVDPVSRRVIRVTGGVQAVETELDELRHPSDLDVVPEPGWLAQLTAGVGALVLLRRRERRAHV